MAFGPFGPWCSVLTVPFHTPDFPESRVQSPKCMQIETEIALESRTENGNEDNATINMNMAT